MTRNGPERHGEVEWVDLGELGSSAAPASDATDVVTERIDAGSGRRPTRRLAVTAAVVVAALTAFALLDHGAAGPPRATRPPATTLAPAAESPSGQAVGEDEQLIAREPQVRRVGAHVLGVRAGWTLFGWGPSGVVWLEPAAGRLTVTPLPRLESSGPVAVAAISDRLIVRPLDDVPGYAVPDGEPARSLTGALRGGGVLLPGPTPELVWRETDDPIPSAVLTRADGSETGTRATLPADDDGTVVADGDGYLLYLTTDGVDDVRPAGVERVTAGWLVATGSGRVLVVECSKESRCSTVLVGLHDGIRRVVGPALPPTETVGQLSPDGRWAAVVVQSPGGRSRLETVDLRSGRVSPVALRAGPALGTAGLVWSPDGRLFALDGAGRLQTVDPARATARRLEIALPALTALTIRPASP